MIQYLDVCVVNLQGSCSVTESKAVTLHLEMSEAPVAIVDRDGGVKVYGSAVPLYGFLVPLCWEWNGNSKEWGMGTGQPHTTTVYNMYFCTPYSITVYYSYVLLIREQGGRVEV